MTAVRPQARLEPHFAAHGPLANALAQPGCVWVSDADGTLWADDIGERFLERLIKDRILVTKEPDVWATYEAKVKADKATGYAWAAQVMAGLSEDEVNRRATAFAAEFVPAHLYPAMRALLEEARAAGCEPWIVSASNEWIVRAAAPLLGIDSAHAVGIRVAVRDGVLTEQVVAPVTYKQGKVEAIRQRIGRTPAIVSGDSVGDLEMFEIATRGAIFVKHPYTDPALLALPQASRWWVESFAMP